MMAAVFSENASVLGYVVSARRDGRGVFFDERCVISVRNEADVLAVLVVRTLKPGVLRDLAYLRLCVDSERKSQPAELLLRQIPENVALILRGIERLLQNERIAALFRPRVMSGGAKLRAVTVREREHFGKLDRFVAENARVRGLAREISADERLNDAFSEIFPLVNGEMLGADLRA